MTLGNWKRPAYVAAAGVMTVVMTVVMLVAAASPPPATVVTVCKDPNCGCCRKWVALLTAKGFHADTVNVPSPEALAVIERDHGITTRLAACHTAVAGG